MHSSFARSRQSLFDEEDAGTGGTPSNANSLFQDDFAGGSGGAGGSPWDMPPPRKPKSRADLLRSLLPASDAPDSYIETFDSVVREDGSAGKVSPGGLMRVLAAAKLNADAQAKIMSIIAPGGGEEITLGRNEFNVFLGLIGLAQEGETVSLDGIDERRRSKFCRVFTQSFSLVLSPTTSTYYGTTTTSTLAHCVFCTCNRQYRVFAYCLGALSLICDRQSAPGGCSRQLAHYRRLVDRPLAPLRPKSSCGAS